MNVKAIRESSAFTELKQALAKNGAAKLWDEIVREETPPEKLGFRPTDLDSVTFCVTGSEIQRGEEPRVRAESSRFQHTVRQDQSPCSGWGSKLKPDARGFYRADSSINIHFPDDKTVVLLHKDLARKYLDGYAKDRSAWPLTTDLTKAAAGHTAFAILNVQKLPLKELREEAIEEFGPLLKAQTVTLTADLKGKELGVAGRAAFPDAATSGKARDKIRKFVGMVADEVEKYTKLDPHRSTDLAALDAFKPIVKEAHRAVKEAKVEVSGSDVTLAASYKADFDIAQLVTDAVKQIKEGAPRLLAQNNLQAGACLGCTPTKTPTASSSLSTGPV